MLSGAPGCAPGSRDMAAMALTDARAALAAGRFDRAIERGDAAVAAARPIGDGATEVAALNLIGRAQRNLARYDAALTAHDQAERVAEPLGDRSGVAEAGRAKGD